MAAARKQGCHILLTHHAGKADRPDGDDILGSTGLLGGVDTSIHIKKREKRRTLFTIQRYGDDIPETVIDLKADGRLEAIGSREHVEVDETLPAILKAIDEGPLTEKEIWEKVEKKHDVVSKGIRLLVERKIVVRSGDGKRGDPYQYGKILSCSPQDIMGKAGRESETGHNYPSSKEKSSPHHLELLARDELASGRALPDENKDPWDV